MLDSVVYSKGIFCLYTGAIYMIRSQQYLVVKVDVSVYRAYVIPTKADYYTSSTARGNIQVIKVFPYPYPIITSSSTSSSFLSSSSSLLQQSNRNNLSSEISSHNNNKTANNSSSKFNTNNTTDSSNGVVKIQNIVKSGVVVVTQQVYGYHKIKLRTHVVYDTGKQL